MYAQPLRVDVADAGTAPVRGEQETLARHRFSGALRQMLMDNTDCAGLNHDTRYGVRGNGVVHFRHTLGFGVNVVRLAGIVLRRHRRPP